MSFARRLRFYLLGFGIGFIFLLFVFGDRMFSWSYLPNDRVLAEIKTKKTEFSPQSLTYLTSHKISKKYITDIALVKGKIKFKESNAQATPCPIYILYYNHLKIKFTKCKTTVTIDSIDYK